MKTKPEEILDFIESVAFSIPTPNGYTPQIIQAVTAMRNLMLQECKGDGWRTIESAPRDEDITILLTDGKRVEAGRYHRSIISREEEIQRKGNRITYELITEDQSFWCGFGDLYGPTHWMPLPQPPTSEGKHE